MRAKCDRSNTPDVLSATRFPDWVENEMKEKKRQEAAGASGEHASGADDALRRVRLAPRHDRRLKVGRARRGSGFSEKMFQPCALGISHDEQKINPRIIILH
jgi:hypothetical protein